MSNYNREALRAIFKKFSNLDYIHPEDIPNIDLYMDQVTTFLDSSLAQAKRNEDEKVLTKTMINNYTKNHILPSPEKKKYTKDHVLSLIMIYYLKSFLSIQDIQSIMGPITERYFGTDHDVNFYEIYEEIVEMGEGLAQPLLKDVMEKYHATQEAFADAPESDQDFLQNFGLICMLSFDVYVKKMMIETLIDINNDTFNSIEKKNPEESSSKS